MKELKVEAYAKINLCLDVLGKRADGYHEVKMVMQSIGICDNLKFSLRKDDELFLNTGVASLPGDKSNLIIKAAEAFFEKTGVRKGYDIVLKKHIPMAAGLAGGSADAAATLIALNELNGKPFSMDELKKIGVGIGADVPFCLVGGTMSAEGIGEVLTPLPNLNWRYVLVVKPPVDVSTPEVYKAYDSADIKAHPDTDGMIEAIRDKKLGTVVKKLGNVLEEVTIPMHPEIELLKEICMKNGALASLMSGSGPTVFALFENFLTAEKVQDILKGTGYDNVHITSFVGNGILTR